MDEMETRHGGAVPLICGGVVMMMMWRGK